MPRTAVKVIDHLCRHDAREPCSLAVVVTVSTWRRSRATSATRCRARRDCWGGRIFIAVSLSVALRLCIADPPRIEVEIEVGAVRPVLLLLLLPVVVVANDSHVLVRKRS